MSDNILFRGKRIDTGEWVEGSLIDGDYILQYIDLAESWEPNTADHKLTCRAWAVTPKSVGQWSNRADWKGTKIFSGDIMGYLYDEPPAPGGGDLVHVEIVFRDGSFGWIGDITGKFHAFTDHPLEDYTVRGNVYDNPELLIKKDDQDEERKERPPTM